MRHQHQKNEDRQTEHMGTLLRIMCSFFEHQNLASVVKPAPNETYDYFLWHVEHVDPVAAVQPAAAAEVAARRAVATG